MARPGLRGGLIMQIHAVLPTYNRGHLLARSVDSFLAAEPPDGVPTALFIVDNNSKDDTGRIAQDHAARHPGRIHAVFDGQQGRHHALNAGIARSGAQPGADPADVVAFFDDDELLDPQWLRVLARNTKDPAVDYVGGEMRPDWKATPPPWFPQGFNGVVGIVQNGALRRQYGDPGFEAMLVGGSTAIRRSVLARCGPYSPDFMYAEDRYMHMQLDRIGAAGSYDPDLVVLHTAPQKRMHNRQIAVICKRVVGPVWSFILIEGKSSSQALSGSVSDQVGQMSDYVGIARPDHWIKNIFMLPGIAAAFSVSHGTSWTIGSNLAFGLVSLCLVASANYTINEYLDSEFDRFHPVKSQRAGAKGLLNARLVLLQYALLCVVGLGLAWAVNLPFFITSAVLLGMGVAYNVNPVRTKDKPFLDTLSESINNPLRFLLGWFIVSPDYFPPGSALMAYWLGGAFLMGVKRYAEFRGIKNPAQAALYRRSFASYTEKSLLLSSFCYAVCSSFFIAVFLMKYRVEFLLTAPLYAILFTCYLAIGMRDDSAAQAPEKLYKERGLLAFAAFTFVISLVLFFVDIPFLQGFTEPYLIPIDAARP